LFCPFLSKEWRSRVITCLKSYIIKSLFGIVIIVVFKVFLILKYIKIIYIFYILKFIFNINTSFQEYIYIYNLIFVLYISFERMKLPASMVAEQVALLEFSVPGGRRKVHVTCSRISTSFYSWIHSIPRLFELNYTLESILCFVS